MHFATIGCYDIWVDIIIPLLSAVLGGAITMWGVVHTIKHEQKKAEEQAIQDVKPWVFSLDPLEDYDYKKASVITLSASEQLSGNTNIQFIIKNTDNGVGIIEKYETENNTYYPRVGRILDKNSVNYINIILSPKETLEDMFLYVNDIYGNSYKYKVILVENPNNGHRIKEVGFIPSKKKST